MARNKRRARKVVLHGLVTPEDDVFEDGSFEYTIVTDDDEKFGLVADELVEDLEDFVWERVTIWGRLAYGLHGPVVYVNDVALESQSDEYEDGFDYWDELVESDSRVYGRF